MKINFKLDERKISKSSRSKIYDLGQVTTTVQDLLDNSEITITDNLIPVIKITSIDDEVSYYLLPDLNYEWGNISGRNTYSFTVNNLIALGGSGSSGDPRPYKVYSALLSQSGTDDPQTATSGSLTQGVTYEIVAFETGDDFTLSGAPNNTVGTKWISNGDAPTWSNGSELGWNGGAPVVDSSFGLNDVWFEKDTVSGSGTGFYYIKSNGNFVNLFIPIIQGFAQSDSNTFYFMQKVDNSTIRITTIDGGGDRVDGILMQTPIQFEIKP